MKSGINGSLREILADTQREIAVDKEGLSGKRLKWLCNEAVTGFPIRSFYDALAGGRALIAEIKEKSPSQGKMRVGKEAARDAYRVSPLVKAISVLTNRCRFGEKMTLEFMSKVKRSTSKSILRKDFIIDEFQVYQARAFGADAILLMANILTKEELSRFSGVAFDLGMDVLFETHCPEELDELPANARIVGINCRNFESGFGLARGISHVAKLLGKVQDTSTNTSRFDYVDKLPSHVVKVAESGVGSHNFKQVLDRGFHAALVGTSLLQAPNIAIALDEFSKALKPTSSKQTSNAFQPAVA